MRKNKMESFRKLDPNNTNWAPQTAREAIKLFYRKKELGHIVWDDLDITFRELARELNQEQFELFVNWITNPRCVKPGNVPDCFPASGYVQSRPQEEDDEKSL
jgi:hypothetical protein